MLIYGKRKIRIKKYDDFHIQCENCSACKQRFSVYQADYFDKSEKYLFLKSELKAYLVDRKITSIKRDYEKTSRFNVEK